MFVVMGSYILIQLFSGERLVKTVKVMFGVLILIFCACYELPEKTLLGF